MKVVVSVFDRPASSSDGSALLLKLAARNRVMASVNAGLRARPDYCRSGILRPTPVPVA